MEIRDIVENDVHILAISGRMDATTVAEFESVAKTLVEQGCVKIIINMANLEYISSAGLRGLLALVKSIKATSGKLAFCNLQPMPAEVFKISGFNSIMTICNSQEDALASMN